MTSDNRDWSKYNEALVRRGEILFDFSTISNCKQEQLNKGKVGEPYHYPNSLIMLLGLIRILYHLPYRQQGFIRALAKYVEGLQAPDYTICRRINKLNINLLKTLRFMNFVNICKVFHCKGAINQKRSRRIY